MNAPDLILDVGNTRTKAALFKEGRLMRHAAWMNRETGAWRSFLAGTVPARAACISVAGPGLDTFEGLGHIVPVTFIRGDAPSPLRMGYGTPGTLGADRLANAAGAWHSFPGRATLAMDLGTCITTDLVEADGTYRGGTISPGARMRARAMHAYSARLPEVDLEGPWHLPGTTTEEALRAGIVHGIIGELHRLIHAYRRSDPDLAVILTGGDGLRFSRALESGIFADPLLTLRGALILLDHSSGPGRSGPV
ncbi:MAG: type III pantothenate kinase [Flavobacteriales bacterium]|nr:type III pantothenate kinase [Flavobacteriales bacterium]